ncbi:hypothetical protein [Thioalkalivibrio sp. ALE16]|uniref:hypothetical protein n=1 Tax=Thioalkalivibrio sp. ALE16 TaxID=1158172 RepID=UPI0003667A2A|nr:hypothetical protein [Thioalkalivibrio sp. ALE16]
MKRSPLYAGLDCLPMGEGCEAYEGYFPSENRTRVLHLNSNNLTDVEGLASLRHVGSQFQLHSNNLTSVQGLRSLREVGSHFRLYGNDLETLDGLGSLTSVGQDFALYSNDLVDISALGNLNEVGRNFYLHNNPRLADLSPLSNLQTLGDSTTIRFDAGIHEREGFVPIQGGALCETSAAAKFDDNTNYATQADVCQ